jgi:hypothetical protein
MAYFFFDFNDRRKRDTRGLLSSLIVQLSRQSDSFSDILFRYHSTHQSGSQQFVDSALAECLEDMLKGLKKTPIYLVIDALDECQNTTGISSSHGDVLALVERLVELKAPNLRLCVTSRPEIDIRRSLEPLMSTHISLHEQDGQKKDIANFVRSVVYTDQYMRRWQEEDKEMVIEKLSERADGV